MARPAIRVVRHERPDGADVLRHAREHALEFGERLADREAAARDSAFANGALVIAALTVLVLAGSVFLLPIAIWLTVRWALVAPAIELEGRDAPAARLRVPPEEPVGTIPVVVTVRDDGDPALTRYGRVLVKVSPGK